MAEDLEFDPIVGKSALANRVTIFPKKCQIFNFLIWADLSHSWPKRERQKIINSTAASKFILVRCLQRNRTSRRSLYQLASWRERFRVAGTCDCGELPSLKSVGLETQAGVEAAVLRQNSFFSGKPQVLLCCELNVCIPVNSYVEVLTLEVTVFGDEAFGR